MAKKRSTRKRKTSTRKGRGRAQSAPAQSHEASEPSAPFPAAAAPQTAVYTWAFAATAPAAPPQRMPVYPAPGPEPVQAPFHAPLQPSLRPPPAPQPIAQAPMAPPQPALPRAPARPDALPADAPRPEPAPELPYRSKGVRPVKLELEKGPHGAVIHSRSGAPEAQAPTPGDAIHSLPGETPAPKKRRGGGAQRGHSISETYEALAQILVPYARMFQSEMHPRMGYCLRAKTTERPPKELYFGGVQIHQEHVSFHLFPLYSFPDLEAKLSPELRQRQEGKTSFHIERGADPALLRELDSLTRACFERLRSQGLNGGEPA